MLPKVRCRDRDSSMSLAGRRAVHDSNTSETARHYALVEAVRVRQCRLLRQSTLSYLCWFRSLHVQKSRSWLRIPKCTRHAQQRSRTFVRLRRTVRCFARDRAPYDIGGYKLPDRCPRPLSRRILQSQCRAPGLEASPAARAPRNRAWYKVTTNECGMPPAPAVLRRSVAPWHAPVHYSSAACPFDCSGCAGQRRRRIRSIRAEGKKQTVLPSGSDQIVLPEQLCQPCIHDPMRGTRIITGVGEPIDPRGRGTSKKTEQVFSKGGDGARSEHPRVAIPMEVLCD